MADKRIYDLDVATLTSAHSIPVDVSGNTEADRVTVATLLAYILADTSTPELIRDTIGTALTAGTGITVTVNDAGDTITVAVSDAELVAIAGLTSAADSLPYFTGSGTASLATFTAAGRALVDDASASAQRTTLGLAIGTDVQAYDATLATAASTTTFTNKTLDSFTNTINADELHIQVRNVTGSTIAKGTPVYVSGYNVGQDLVEVAPADASSSATMPAIGIMEASLANNTTGSVDRTGRISSLDTSAFTIGDKLYVSETTGALTATRPSSPAITQQIATVLRVHATLGVLDVGSNAALIPGTTTAVGGVELATSAETITGTDTERAVTPAGGAAAYQPLDAELTAVAGLTSAADRLPYFTGSGTASLATFTAAGRALVDDADAAAQRTTLELGTAALISSTAGGDLSGTLPSPTVAKINGITVTGTPAVGYVPTATSSSAATWQAASSGGAIGPPAITSVEAWVRPSGGTSAAWTAFTQNLLTLRPCFLRAGTLIRIGTETNTSAAGSFYRLGIYSEATGGGPGALLLDAGQLDFTATSGFKSITISQVVTSGVYWMASVQQGAASGAACISEKAGGTNIMAMMPVRWAGSGNLYDFANSMFTQASVSGALPSSITLSGLTASENAAPITVVRYG